MAFPPSPAFPLSRSSLPWSSCRCSEAPCSPPAAPVRAGNGSSSAASSAGASAGATGRRRVVVMPLITVTIAAAADTLASPPEGWLTTATDYLVATFLVGTLVINLWAETSWQGLVQRHLTGRFGLARGALLTAVPFVSSICPCALPAGRLRVRGGDGRRHG